ncbi:hypothetical protein V2J09_022016 [Rumex salicifolius]
MTVLRSGKSCDFRFYSSLKMSLDRFVRAKPLNHFIKLLKKDSQIQDIQRVQISMKFSEKKSHYYGHVIIILSMFHFILYI